MFSTAARWRSCCTSPPRPCGSSRAGSAAAHRLGRRWVFIHDEVAAALRALRSLPHTAAFRRRRRAGASRVQSCSSCYRSMARSYGSSSRRWVECDPALRILRPRARRYDRDGHSSESETTRQADCNAASVTVTRGRAPAFTLREAATYLNVPNSTLHHWPGRPTARRRSSLASRAVPRGDGPVHRLRRGLRPVAFRRAGCRCSASAQRSRAVLRDRRRVCAGFQALYTDGAEVLYDFATSEGDEELGGLTVVRTGRGSSPRLSGLPQAITTAVMAGHRVRLPSTRTLRLSLTRSRVWNAARRSWWRARGGSR